MSTVNQPEGETTVWTPDSMSWVTLINPITYMYERNKIKWRWWDTRAHIGMKVSDSIRMRQILSSYHFFQIVYIYFFKVEIPTSKKGKTKKKGKLWPTRASKLRGEDARKGEWEKEKVKEKKGRRVRIEERGRTRMRLRAWKNHQLIPDHAGVSRKIPCQRHCQ